MIRHQKTLSWVALLLLTSWAGCNAERNEDGTTIPTTSSTSTGTPPATTSDTTTTATTSSSSSGGTYPCNPVTSRGCAPEQACDSNYNTLAYECYDPPNGRALCAECGVNMGWCLPGSTCFRGNCAKFCCDNADCSANASCDKAPLALIGLGEVGICLGGCGGAGGDNCEPLLPHDCDAPTPSPSDGVCVPGWNAGGSGGSGGS